MMGGLAGTGGLNKEGKLTEITVNVEAERKNAARMHKEMVAMNQRKDRLWVEVNRMMEGGGNKTTIEVNLENFYDEL